MLRSVCSFLCSMRSLSSSGAMEQCIFLAFFSLIKWSHFPRMGNMQRERRLILLRFELSHQKYRERVKRQVRMKMTSRIKISKWERESRKIRTMRRMTMRKINRIKNYNKKVSQKSNKTSPNLNKRNRIPKTNYSLTTIITTSPGSTKATRRRKTSIPINPSPKTDLPSLSA